MWSPLDFENEKGKGLKGIMFECDKASLVVNALCCMFVKGVT